MFCDSSNYSLHLNLSEYVRTIETGCKSGVDHISSIIVILNNTSSKKAKTETIETGCKSGLDDSCEENNQMGQTAILSDLVMLIFDDYLTLHYRLRNEN